jgi:hypothetical protein
VDGELRVSLSWYNYDDLDLHVVEPGRHRIYFSSKHNPHTTGTLDVDMNAGSATTRQAVENIVWTDKAKMDEGVYQVIVNNYNKRETSDTGFVVEVECNGEVFNFEHKLSPRSSDSASVINFEYSKTKGITIKGDAKSNVVQKEKWNIKTNQFLKVRNIMNSPNFWDKKSGNKHYFFMINDCVSDEVARPFFNEFLNDQLTVDRKVFEVLGSKIKVPHSNDQLSGIGFSDTQRNHLIVRVNGSFKRNIKVTF